jgi:hypothetical protein
MRYIRLLGVGMSALFCVGCASVVNDKNQPVKVETKAESGELVAEAECRLTNDYGNVTVKSGQVALVHRSGKDLDITCTSTQQKPAAVGRAISRANGGMWGNILLGGGIGAIVDHNKGTAYTYPTWVQLVFGKTLVFDRTNEKEGEPVTGKDPAIPDGNADAQRR